MVTSWGGQSPIPPVWPKPPFFKPLGFFKPPADTVPDCAQGGGRVVPWGTGGGAWGAQVSQNMIGVIKMQGSAGEALGTLGDAWESIFPKCYHLVLGGALGGLGGSSYVWSKVLL